MSPNQVEVVQSWIFPRSLPGEKTEAEIVEGIRSLVASVSRLAAENAELRKQCATLEADAATAGKLLRAAQDRIDSDICSGRSHAPECDAIEEFHREDHAE